MEELIQFDKQLLLMLNGSDSYYLDQVVLILTNAKTWIPLYVSLLFLVVKNNHNWRTILLILAGAGLCVLMAGTIDDEIPVTLLLHFPRPLRFFLRSSLCPLLQSGENCAIIQTILENGVECAWQDFSWREPISPAAR